MTHPQQPPPGMPPPATPQPTSVSSGPLIPQWVVVCIAGALLFGYMIANDFTGAQTVGTLFVLSIGAIIVLVIRALVRLGDKRPSPVVVNTVSALPPPGWYVDPQGATRWFDGQQWTDKVQPPTAS